VVRNSLLYAGHFHFLMTSLGTVFSAIRQNRTSARTTLGCNRPCIRRQHMHPPLPCIHSHCTTPPESSISWVPRMAAELTPYFSITSCHIVTTIASSLTGEYDVGPTKRFSFDLVAYSSHELNPPTENCKPQWSCSRR